MSYDDQLDKRGIIFIGDYFPRQCGIATFTYDLRQAVAKVAGTRYRCGVVAINDIPEGYRYDESVRFEVREAAQSDYRQAAEFVNVSDASVVCLQHEYGIYGGKCGSHILGLLRRLRRPFVATLHTVLKDPTEQQLLVMKDKQHQLRGYPKYSHHFLHLGNKPFYRCFQSRLFRYEVLVS